MKRTFNLKNSVLKKTAIAIFLLLLIIGLVLVLYIDQFGVERAKDQGTWGQFGDYVGGILNPILSFCAFVGLLITLNFQHAESRKAEDRQYGQQFDLRLFQMLELLNASLAATCFYKMEFGNNLEVKGNTAIGAAWGELSSALQTLNGNRPDVYDAANLIFVQWSLKHSDSMLSYFDTVLFTAMYFSKHADAEGKEFAFRALRSQISRDGRALLLYMLILTKNVHLYLILDEYLFWGDEPSRETLPLCEVLIQKMLNTIKLGRPVG